MTDESSPEDVVEPKSNREVIEPSDSRLHPMSWLFIVIEMVKSLFVPILIILFAGRGDNYEIIGMIFVVPAIIYAIIQAFVYRYRLTSNEIIIREGVLVKNIRHVKFSRIQNLNLAQNPLHKILGVTQLELESASGGKPEAVMRVISLTAAEEIRSAVNQAKSANQNENAEEVTENTEHNGLLSISFSELIRAGIISNKGMVVVAFAFGILSQTRALDDFFQNIEERINSVFSQFTFDFGHPVMVVVLTVLGLVLFFLFIRILSIIYMVFTYYGFELTLSQRKLFAKYGLLTQLQISVPQTRIQLVSRIENILHRYFDRSSVRMATAGGGAAQSGNAPTKSLRWVAPIIERSYADEFIQKIAPSISSEVTEWHCVPKRAWLRIFRAQIFITSLVALPLAIFVDAGFLLIFGWLAFGIVYAKKTIASIRYGLSDNALVIQAGWIVNRFTLIPFNKIQSVHWHQGILDRRNQMANIYVDIAGLEITKSNVGVPYLDEPIARELHLQLYDVVSKTEYRWAS